MELFLIIVNGFQPLTIIRKCSILDVAAVLDQPLLHKGMNCAFLLSIVPCAHIKETQNCACSIERKPLTFVAILPNTRKNLAKILQYKVSQTFATFWL